MTVHGPSAIFTASTIALNSISKIEVVSCHPEVLRATTAAHPPTPVWSLKVPSAWISVRAVIPAECRNKRVRASVQFHRIGLPVTITTLSILASGNRACPLARSGLTIPSYFRSRRGRWTLPA
jgi:hypothetical protein